MNHWKYAFIASIAGVAIVYFIMPFIDKISQKLVKHIIYNIKPVRAQFFKNLREKKIFKPNIFIIEVFVFIGIFISIFSYRNMNEFKMQLVQKMPISSDTTGAFLYNSVYNINERFNNQTKKVLHVNIFILFLLVCQRAVASMLLSMLNNFKSKKLELLKTAISEKDFVVFDFKWGEINSFDDYNNLCVELDEYSIKFPKKEEPRV